MNSILWVSSVPLAIFSRFTNTRSVVWDKAGKAVRHEMKHTEETMLSPLESFQQTGQMYAGSHSVIKTGLDQHAVSAVPTCVFTIFYFVPYVFIDIFIHDPSYDYTSQGVIKVKNSY